MGRREGHERVFNYGNIETDIGFPITFPVFFAPRSVRRGEKKKKKQISRGRSLPRSVARRLTPRKRGNFLARAPYESALIRRIRKHPATTRQRRQRHRVAAARNPSGRVCFCIFVGRDAGNGRGPIWRQPSERALDVNRARPYRRRESREMARLARTVLTSVVAPVS